MHALVFAFLNSKVHCDNFRAKCMRPAQAQNRF